VLRCEVDVILMDLWMPYMDGYEASEKILNMSWTKSVSPPEGDVEIGGVEGTGCAKSKVPTILAVTADVTDGALEKAATVGMKGFLTKPFKVVDLERLILEYCAAVRTEVEVGAVV
jgi:CheY-like chemotaxis protein